MSNRFRRGGVLFAFALLSTACNELTDLDSERAATAFTILDGAHGGTAHFFFLPPMVPAPAYSGTFDGSQSPIVQICELTGNVCGTLITTFSGAAIKVDLEKESYGVLWKTKDAGLDPSKTYRISVQVGTSELGFADVVVLANGSQIKTVDRNQFAATINGGVLNIRFRIERTAPPPPPCTPGTPGCAWNDGDVITYPDDQWGNPSVSIAQLLLAHFDAVYFSASGVLQVGGPNTMTFTSAEAVLNYLPAIGTPGPLVGNLVNPLNSVSSAFGGVVVALKLNVDFSAAGHTIGTAAVPFGSLTLCGLEAPLDGLNGITVADFLAIANTALGGGASSLPISELYLLAITLNGSFENGVAIPFAQQHLVNGPCPVGLWQTGDVLGYSQFSWGEQTQPGGALLYAQYDAVYASTLGEVEVGIPGVGGYSIILTGLISALDYVPSTGPAAALTADLIDPLSSVSGVFGGEVFALHFNIDFSDAGHLVGTSGLRFGDLLLCGLTGSLAGLNGQSVRAFSSIVNTALGGGSTPYTIAEISQTTFDINNAFNGAAVSPFGQQHLRDGSCT